MPREEVVAARRRNDRWEVETRTTRYEAPHLVVATGLNREPIVPQWPGQENYRARVMHSSVYKNGSAFRGGRVLVVGIGNSGAEIALDLHENGVEPTIAVRSPVNVLPRDILGIPVVVAAMLAGLLPAPIADTINAPLLRLVLGNLRAYWASSGATRPLTQIARTGRIPLIDVGTIALIKKGRIAIRPGIDRFVEDGVMFSDGLPRAIRCRRPRYRVPSGPRQFPRTRWRA